MPASDIEQRTDEAVTTVLCQDTTLRTIMGRASATDDVVINWDDLDDARLPALTKLIVTTTPIGGAGDNYRILIDFSAYAVDKATVRSILERLEVACTPALLLAQGLDGVVLNFGPRIPAPMERKGTRMLYGEVTTLTLWVTK